MTEHDDALRALRQELSRIESEVRGLDDRLRQLEQLEQPAAPRAPAEAAPERASESPAPAPVSPPPAKPATRHAPAAEPTGPRRPIQWERFIGTYLIPRLGVIVIAIGVVIGLSHVVPRISAGGRLAMGYLIALGLAGAGFWLERRYARLGPVLLGGGFSTAYITTYAANFVEYVKVLDGTPTAALSLGLVVAAWAGVAQWRRSMTMGALTTGLAHFTVFLVQPAAWSVVGILLLTAGSSFLILKNRWYLVGALGLVGTWVNHMVWLWHQSGGETATELALSLGIVSSYYLLYAVADAFLPDSVRRGELPLWLRSAFTSANTAAFLALGVLTCRSFDIARDHVEVFLYASSALLAAFAWFYWRRRNADPLFNLFAVKAATVLTAGFAVHFEAHSLTLALGLEALALLVAARWSGLLVKRYLAVAAGALCTLHGLAAGWASAPPVYGAQGYAVAAVGWIAVVAAMSAASVLYQVTGWTRLGEAWARRLEPAKELLWLLDLRQPPESMKGLRWFLPGCFAGGAAVLAVRATVVLVPASDRMLASGLAALAFVGLAALTGSRALAVWSLLPALAAPIQLWTALEASAWDGVPSGLAVLALLLYALVTEARWRWRPEGLAPLRVEFVAFGLYAAVALVAGSWIIVESSSRASAAWLLGCAVAAALASRILRRGPQELALGVFLLFASVSWGLFSHEYGPGMFHGVAWAAILLPFVMAGAFGPRDGGVSKALWVPLGVAWLMAMFVYAEAAIGLDWYAAFVSGLGAGIVVLGWWRGLRGLSSLGAGSVVLGAGTSVVLAIPRAMRDMAGLDSTWGALAGILLPTACAVFLERRGASLLGMQEPAGERLQNVAAWSTGVLLAVAPLNFPVVVEDYLPVAWGLAGFALFALALVSGRQAYRFAGLAVLTLALVRLGGVVLAAQIDVLLKVGAAVGLGLVLLVVGYFYFRAVFRTQE